MRVAHELVVKGYARPAFGGTSRRRSIMKTHQLSRWVTFFEKMIQQYGVAAFALFPLPEGGGFFVPAKNFYRIL